MNSSQQNDAESTQAEQRSSPGPWLRMRRFTSWLTASETLPEAPQPEARTNVLAGMTALVLAPGKLPPAPPAPPSIGSKTRGFVAWLLAWEHLPEAPGFRPDRRRRSALAEFFSPDQLPPPPPAPPTPAPVGFVRDLLAWETVPDAPTAPTATSTAGGGGPDSSTARSRPGDHQPDIPQKE